MTTATEEAAAPVEESTIPPFGIEADHPRCSDLLIQCIPGLRLRSVIDGSRPAKDHQTGEMRVPRDQAISMGDFPRTPGMQLHVNPRELTYVALDPVADDESMQDRVLKWMNQHTPYRGDKLKVEKTVASGKLDRHRMKSLCREMYNLVAAGEAKKCRGAIPDIEDIDALPGHYLLNPGLRTQTTQPQFEKDFDAWMERLANVGG